MGQRTGNISGALKRIDMRTIVMPALLVFLIIFFTITCPGTFLTWYNFKNMLSQSSYILIAAVGLTFVIIGGGVDLAIGYEMSLVGIVVGMLILTQGWNMWLAIGVGLLLGILMGFLNGLIVVKLKVFPLVITLSTSFVFQGLSFIISNSRTFIGFDEVFRFIGQGDVGPIPMCIIIAVVVCAVSYFVLNKTYFGRHVYALGGNEEAAKLSGVNTERMRYILYSICGLCAALAAIVLTSRAASSSPSLGPDTEFTCLSGCILGGITLDGGEGNISGMIIGILIITILGNGMQLMYLGTYPQYVVKGIVLIAAMGFDVYQKKKKKLAQ